MDWTVYWFQSIACFGFASVAMFSGITGAALMLPWFVLAFPLLGVPEITIHQAIAAALFLETAAFSIGIYRYARRGLIETKTVRAIAVFVVPLAVAGALVSHWAPETALRLVYAGLMTLAAWLLLRQGGEGREHEACAAGSRASSSTARGRRTASVPTA